MPVFSRLFAIVTLLSTFSFSLHAQTAKALRDQQWREDITYLKERYPAYDKTLTPVLFANPADSNQLYYAVQPNRIEAFLKGADSLYNSVERLSNEQLMIGLCRLVALSPNAHSRLYLFRVRTILNNVALGLGFFNGSLHVVAAPPPAQSSLLGAQVIAINGVAIDSLRNRVAPLVSGNASWQQYMSLYFLRSPQALVGMGLGTDTAQLTFRLRLATGIEQTKIVSAAPGRPTGTIEAWKDWSPVTVKSDSLQHLLAGKTLPLYLQHTDQYYSHAWLDGGKTGYLQFNRNENASTLSFYDYITRLRSEMKQQDLRKFVLDLRFNTGGNNDISTRALRELAGDLAGKQVFILTGTSTFSAGVTTAAFFKYLTGAKIYGEPAGDGLIYLSEGGNVILPNSGLAAHYANGLHNEEYVKGFSIQPDQVIRPTFAEYAAGRDPVLEAVLKQ